MAKLSYPKKARWVKSSAVALVVVLFAGGFAYFLFSSTQDAAAIARSVIGGSGLSAESALLASHSEFDSPAVQVSVAGQDALRETSIDGSDADLASSSEEAADAPDADIARLIANAAYPGLPYSGENVTMGVVERGDTVGAILEAWISPTEMHDLESQCKATFALNKVRLGQPYAIISKGDNLLRFEYEIDKDSKLIISKTEDGSFNVKTEDIVYDVVLHRVDGTIRNNLFSAMSDANEDQSLAASIAEVFAWEINFIRDIRVGDSFTMLVEKRYRDGEFKGYGKMLAATFVNQGKPFEAYLYTDGQGVFQYYTADGSSLKRAFLKAPLSYTRISSGYTSRRLHPITMTWKAHPAIDYAAPTGTPVKCVGRGTVSFVGRSAGAGKYIKVQHANGYETMYLHLSAFARGLKKGQRVGQGQVIGFVGQTGYATGPHLDFRMKKNGNYLNPLKELSPRDTPVVKAELPMFKQQVAEYKDYLDNKKNLAEYGKTASIN